MGRRENVTQVDCAEVRSILAECKLTILGAIGLGKQDPLSDKERLKIEPNVLRRMVGGRAQSEYATKDINTDNVLIFESWAKERLPHRKISIEYDHTRRSDEDDEYKLVERDPEITLAYCRNIWKLPPDEISTSDRLGLLIQSAITTLYSVNSDLKKEKIRSTLFSPSGDIVCADKKLRNDISAFSRLYNIVVNYEKQRREICNRIWDFNDHIFPLTSSFDIYTKTLGLKDFLDGNYTDEKRKRDQVEAKLWHDKLVIIHETYSVPYDKNLLESEAYCNDIRKMSDDILLKSNRLMKTIEVLEEEVLVMNAAFASK